MRIKRFNSLERCFHFFLIVTFLIQTATGFSRVFVSTHWGERLIAFWGGYKAATTLHIWVGMVMIIGFVIHTFYILARIRWRNFSESVFGPDSLMPNLNDARNITQQVLYFFGLRPPPRFDRWTYWEKFDYWAVYWGMPLLAITGLMTAYPLMTSQVFPGWFLNIAALLHRAEAVLAVSYIFIVHFFIGHLRPFSFPMNEAMFSGSVPLEELQEEKPVWVARLENDGQLQQLRSNVPARWFRIAYFMFGYAALCVGIYLLVNGIIYSRFVSFH
ncbi:MAG: cytochrome b/b6 domain-containing protein [Desulfobacterales bacterium]|nr:cytochrome b/b6 domain-containing protein [Desulfobacterales bacterium]